jgi:hypothetical protein
VNNEWILPVYYRYFIIFISSHTLVTKQRKKSINEKAVRTNKKERNKEMSQMNSTYRRIKNRISKVKVNLSLCLNWTPGHEGVLGNGGIAPRILDLGTRWRWVVSFTPLPPYPWERAPGTLWIGGWVGPRAGMDAVVKRKIPSHCRNSNPRSYNP